MHCFHCRATTEALRIRKDVAKKIDEIDAVVQVSAGKSDQELLIEFSGRKAPPQFK